MKLSLALSVVLASFSMAEAFAPLKFAGASPSALHMAEAVTTKKYTFTKSDEIFTEAKTVRTRKRNDYQSITRISYLLLV
jgi:hypothetical protein